MSEAKIIELESRVSFQEDLLESLNARIAQQENELSVMTVQLQHLNKKLKLLENNIGDVDEDHIPPPHY